MTTQTPFWLFMLVIFGSIFGLVFLVWLIRSVVGTSEIIEKLESIGSSSSGWVYLKQDLTTIKGVLLFLSYENARIQSVDIAPAYAKVYRNKDGEYYLITTHFTNKPSLSFIHDYSKPIYQPFASATPTQMSNLQIIDNGRTIYWPDLNQRLTIQELVLIEEIRTA